VSQVGTLPEAGLPATCPPGLAEFPTLADAVNLSRLPNSISYTTGQSIAQARAFYEKEMLAAGWTVGTGPIERPEGVILYYLQESNQRIASVHIWDEQGVTQVIASENSTVPAAPRPGETTAPQTNSPAMRTSKAFGLLTGDSTTPGVFNNYHLEVDSTSPSWDRDSAKVKTEHNILKADVDGKNIHLFFNASTDPNQLTEGYLLGETGYQVKDGKLEEDLFQVSGTWMGWQLEVVFPYSFATAGPAFDRNDTLDGRPVEVYTVDSQKAAQATLEMLKSFMLVPVTRSAGTLWVDAETGALLKAVLDYEAEFTDSETKAVLGSGTGHVEVSASQIGKVTVAPPQ
jgi:hypothetical protein